MNRSKVVRNVLVAFAMAGLLILLASAMSWGYYSEGIGHYAAVALASPFIVANQVSAGVIGTAIAFVIYFGFSFLLVSLVSKVSTR